MAQNEHPDFGITPRQSLEEISSTLDRSRNAMYLAGWPNIMLLWGIIASIGYFSQFAVESLASGFATTYPWYPGPLWAGLGFLGMIGSAFFGRQASRMNSEGSTATGIGIRVFFFWLAVVSAAFVVPAAAGMWTLEWPNAEAIPGVAIGIIALGYVLFGILHHPAISLVGLGMAAAFYIPFHISGDAFMVISAVLMLAVVASSWIWIRKSERP